MPFLSKPTLPSWQTVARETTHETMAGLETGPDGLTVREAKARLMFFGPNRIEPEHGRGWKIFRRQFHSSLIWLLLLASALSFILGQRVESGLILAFLFLNAGLGFFQEYRSVKAVALLRRYLVQTVRVKRAGRIRRLPADRLVPGDIILFQAGDILPADARLITAHELSCDEQALTGESLLVQKSTESKGRAAHFQDANAVVFAGTSVTRGSGEAVVFATGTHTVFGEIAQLTRSTERVSAFEQQINRFSAFILRLVVATLLIMYAANLILKRDDADPVMLLVFFLVLVVSVLPEALPFFTTVALSRGSLRLAKRRVVVKRLSAIEDLGSIEVLCSDKTGTLTEKDITVSGFQADDPEACLSAAVLAGDGFVALASGQEPDPFDTALLKKCSIGLRRQLERVERVFALPFDPERKRSSALVARPGQGPELIVRGAPESVLSACVDLSSARRTELLAEVTARGKEGVRTLAVATKIVSRKQAYAKTDEEETLSFQGLVFFTDPVNASAPEALKKARALGVTVKIITGDSAEVAEAVARKVNLIGRAERALHGTTWDGLSSAERERAVEQHAVFARIGPRQKYEIIETLQRKYEVGFLGEGINDAPALKLSHVALAVHSASDIAREAADVVLLDPSLDVIIDGIREGRRTFANIKKYIKMTLASNFGNFYSVAVASLFVPFVPLLPVQMLLIDILSGLPVLAYAADSVEEAELRRPKTYDVKNLILLATLFGIVSSVFDFTLFASLFRGEPAQLQTSWFLLSLLTEMVVIFALRTRRPFWQAERPAAILMGLAFFAALTGLILPFTAFGQNVFGFVAPSAKLMAFIGILVFCYLITTETVKYWYYRFEGNPRR